MDTETKTEFKHMRKQFDRMDKQFESSKREFERLAIMVADGFADVSKRFDVTDGRIDSIHIELKETRIEFKADIAELRESIRSVRADIARLPDEIDATYSETINDLLERVAHLEQRIKTLELSRA